MEWMRYMGEFLECEIAGERDTATVDMMIVGACWIKTVITALPLANFGFDAREMGN